MDGLDERIRPTLETLTQQLMDSGVTAVALTGSWARGDPHQESDLDLLILGEGTPYSLERRDGFLLSMSWLSFEQAAETMRRPASACFTVPGWRDAYVLYDPEGLASHLKDEASAWEFAQIEAQARQWVPEEICDYAEEVQKLAGLIERQNLLGMASQRAVLALRLAPVLAVHLELLYRTENDLWNVVAERMGDEWLEAQRRALAADPVPLAESCDAALKLYALAAAEVRDLFDERQLAVVRHACKVAGRPLDDPPPPASEPGDAPKQAQAE
jgi:hypothetical protein